MDPEALLYRPPQSLSGIDFLPSALVDAWSTEAEPKTTISALYAAIKATHGKPWPRKLFLDGLNAAVAQGFMSRLSGSGPISSLERDGNVELIIRRQAPPPPPPPPPPIGRKFTNTVLLGIGEVQTLGEEIGDLTKSLAGCDPQIEVRLTIKSKPGLDLAEVTKILNKIKQGWKI
jgi:hypothetical protein